MLPNASCVVLAEPHQALAEGLRGLLGTAFDVVVMVADERSLVKSVERLAPAAVVVELALGGGDIGGLIGQLLVRCPGVKVLVLGGHSEASVADFTIRAGASAYLLNRDIASDLLPAVAAMLRGERYGAPQHQPAEVQRG
jgi:DNA-binding NarL/FixJ family response regulator